MANTISELANVHTYKPETIKSENRSDSRTETKKTSDDRKSSADVKSGEELINKLESLPQMIQRNLEFSIDEGTGQQVVRVVDGATGELVRQIPSDQMLRIIAQLDETLGDLQPGVMLDEKY